MGAHAESKSARREHHEWVKDDIHSKEDERMPDTLG
jgi:hypothetical protein